MTRALWIAAALAASACPASKPPVAQPSSPSDPSAPEAPPPLATAADPALAKRVDAVLDKALADQRIVGMVVVVARDGAVVYSRAVGHADREAKRPMREDTIFRLASMTKPITSATALVLVDRGKLSLDDAVTKYLPDFKPKLADGRAPAITVRHLITHTSGLTYKFLEKPDGPYHKANVSDGLAEPGLTGVENLKRLASAPLVFEPGTTFNYSLSTDVLGEVVARAGGDTLPALVKELVTKPAGMIDTTFAVTDRERIAWPYAPGRPPVRMTDPHDLSAEGLTVRFAPARIFDSGSYPSGGVGAAGTAQDYLRFCEALRTGKLLKPETARAMTENHVAGLKGADFLGPGSGFGLGFGLTLDPAAAKSPVGRGTYGWGGIYGTTFKVDPVNKLSIVILGNVALGPDIGDDVQAAIYAAN